MDSALNKHLLFEPDLRMFFIKPIPNRKRFSLMLEGDDNYILLVLDSQGQQIQKLSFLKGEIYTECEWLDNESFAIDFQVTSKNCMNLP